MSTNEKISTFAAFCELITEYALNNEDFLLLTTEEVTETELLTGSPRKVYSDGVLGGRGAYAGRRQRDRR